LRSRSDPLTPYWRTSFPPCRCGNGGRSIGHIDPQQMAARIRYSSLQPAPKEDAQLVTAQQRHFRRLARRCPGCATRLVGISVAFQAGHLSARPCTDGSKPVVTLELAEEVKATASSMWTSHAIAGWWTRGAPCRSGYLRHRRSRRPRRSYGEPISHTPHGSLSWSQFRHDTPEQLARSKRPFGEATSSRRHPSPRLAHSGLDCLELFWIERSETFQSIGPSDIG
jgi:hypothetical protein